MSDRLPNALPVEHIHEFWGEVEESLRSKYQLQGDQPVRGILRYRNEIDRAGSIVYHRLPADVADDIVSGEYVHAGRKTG